ncbi:hypothetical protein SLA2020_143760 [Shorea laevis]
MGTRKREEELDRARRGKRPATAHTTPSHTPIGGFMAEARQNYGLPVAALATQGPLLSTNKGAQIQMREATHDRDASTSSWMPPGSEFLNLPLLDTMQLYLSLQNQFNGGLTLIGQGNPIEDNDAIQSVDPPVVGPHSIFLPYDWLEKVASEPNVFTPRGDAANMANNGPQFQAANARANNVEQEDDANDQRMDEATEADNCILMWLRDPDGGEDL